MSDRKYKQRGYRESDAAPRERAAPHESSGARPAADRRDAPRGRGLGAPTEDVFRCARCGQAAPVGTAMALEARCGGCGADFHACVHCVSFDSGAPLECRQPIPARVSPKDRANRCELFEPRLRQEFAQEKPPQEKATPGDARSAFDALFKF